LGRSCVPPGALAQLGRVSRFVAETANLAFDEHAPYVGRSAFAHKGGVHVAAIRRAPRAYEHIDPALVGGRTRVTVSELSGRGNVLARAEQLEIALGADAATGVLARVKHHEQAGYAFESAEASVALLLHRARTDYVPPFQVIDYKVLLGARAGDVYAEAAVKVVIGGALRHVAAEGPGPVAALDAALRKALIGDFPELAAIHLEDFKVRILDGRDGTSAVTRVLIDHGNATDHWTTVGASANLVEAARIALVDGLEHGLQLARPTHRLPKGSPDEVHD